MFDLWLLITLVVAAFFLQSKSAYFLVAEKAVMFLFWLLFVDSVRWAVFHIVFSYSGFLFLLILKKHIEGHFVLKLATNLLALVHAVIVISYYLLPYEVYLTVYNSYPATYLILVSLQFIGVCYGSGRHINFFSGGWGAYAVARSNLPLYHTRDK